MKTNDFSPWLFTIEDTERALVNTRETKENTHEFQAVKRLAAGLGGHRCLSAGIIKRFVAEWCDSE